jgi:hypothetical protein
MADRADSDGVLATAECRAWRGKGDKSNYQAFFGRPREREVDAALTVTVPVVVRTVMTTSLLAAVGKEGRHKSCGARDHGANAPIVPGAVHAPGRVKARRPTRPRAEPNKDKLSVTTHCSCYASPRPRSNVFSAFLDGLRQNFTSNSHRANPITQGLPHEPTFRRNA